MGKIKIAYFHHVTAISGGEIMLLELVRNLNKKIFKPIVFLLDRGELYQKIKELGIEVILINYKSIKKKNPIQFLQNLFKVYCAITKHNINIIHSTHRLNRYIAIVSKITGIPCICHIHLVLPRRKISQFLLKWPDILIAVSRAVANSLINSGISEFKIRIIYNGIDMLKFSPIPCIGKLLKLEFGIRDSGYLIGIVGRIHPEKGHKILIDALDRVNKLINKKVYLLIVGYDERYQNYWVDRQYIKYLKEKIKEKKIEKQVIFSGFRDDMEAVYNALDLLVVPSICEEALGIIQLEAMATEIPVIASSVGGIPEVNMNNRTGILVNPNDPMMLSQAIIDLIDNTNKARRIAVEARKLIESQFNIKKCTLEHENLYRDLIR